MKNVSFLLLVVFAISFTACSQVKIPAGVKSAFEKEFPDVKNVKWEEEEDGIWEAAFKMDGKKMSVAYDAEGNWQETETMIKTSELPEVVVNAIKAEFEGFEIDEAQTLETADFSGYEVEIEKEDGKEEVEMEIHISKDGVIIKKESGEDDEGEEEEEDEGEDDEGEEEDDDDDDDEGDEHEDDGDEGEDHHDDEDDDDGK